MTYKKLVSRVTSEVEQIISTILLPDYHIQKFILHFHFCLCSLVLLCSYYKAIVLSKLRLPFLSLNFFVKIKKVYNAHQEFSYVIITGFRWVAKHLLYSWAYFQVIAQADWLLRAWGPEKSVLTSRLCEWAIRFLSRTFQWRRYLGKYVSLRTLHSVNKILAFM